MGLRDDSLWRQEYSDENGRRPAYVERPVPHRSGGSVPMGIEGAYHKSLDYAEALDMATALVSSVRIGLGHSMDPALRQEVERRLDAIVVEAQNALRWRTTPRKATDE